MSDTPLTDALRVKYPFSKSNFFDILIEYQNFERENQQLRDDLKQCAEVLHKLKWHDLRSSHVATECFVCERVDSALSLPSVKNALKVCE